MKQGSKDTSAKRATPPRRLFLIGAALTVPWFITFYFFDVQDAVAALLALAGYILIFTAAGKVALAWFKQRRQ